VATGWALGDGLVVVLVVGACQVDFALIGVHSLKQKRGIVRRIIDRTRNRFSIAVAEVEYQNTHGRAGIGLAVVGSDSQLVNSVLDRAIQFMEELHLAPIVDTQLELIHL
jgi:uncharacterized protein